MASKDARGESRRERKKRETRKRILRAAQLHFARVGYDASTVEMIAESADISKPTLFNYFPSKLAILHTLMPAMDRHFARAVDRSRARGGSTASQIRGFFDHIAGTALAAPPMARTLLLQFLRSYESPPEEREHQRFPLLQARMEQLLREGVEKGEVRRDMSPGRLYQYITGVYVYGMLNWLADPDFSVANELRLASRFIESALLEADGRKTPAR